MLPLVDFSQFGQPSVYRRFLPPEVDRVLIDVGAHDGIEGSNSRELLIEGWRGVLLEPLPEVFCALERNSAGLNAMCVNAACSDREGVSNFYIGWDGVTGQSSSLSEDPSLASNRSGEAIRVTVRTLRSIAIDCGIPSQFGLLTVDAEGCDLEVLRGFDLDRWRPAVICTEEFPSNPAINDEKHHFLCASGYDLRCLIGVDSIWTCSTLVGGRCWPTPQRGYVGERLPEDVARLPVLDAGIAYVDRISEADGTMTISGWAILTEADTPSVVIAETECCDGNTIWVQAARHPRSDVVRNFGSERVLFSGFRFHMDGSQQEIRRLRIHQVSDTGRARCVPQPFGPYAWS